MPLLRTRIVLLPRLIEESIEYNHIVDKKTEQMRKGFISLAVALLLVSAACQNEQTFQVEGEIKEAAGKTLYFETVALDGIKVLDSVKLDNRGAFHFAQKRPDGPDFYRLRIDRRVINLGVDSTEVVKVTAKLPVMATDYTVEGSDESLKIKEITLQQKTLQDNLKKLLGRRLAPGDFQDSVDVMIGNYKERMKRDFIYQNPRAGYAYYALFQRINGSPLFNPEINQEDTKVFRAVTTSWDLLYPHSLRALNLHGITMRSMRNARSQRPVSIPEEMIHEVTLLDLNLPDMHGANRTLSSLKGKVVLLDFTVYMNQASPARNIALRELYTQYAPQGLEIYQVSFDGDEHFWKTSADNLPWICVRDVNGSSATTYHVTDLPTYFLIDRENALYKRSSDIKDIEQLRMEIEKLLK